MKTETTMNAGVSAVPEMPKKKGGAIKILIILIVLAGIAAGYFFMQWSALQKNPNVVNERKIREVETRIARLIEVPAGELPTLATVSDIEQLKDQPFFKNAKIGDQVLIYSNARRAYLYDPAANVIVEVASLNIGQ